MLKDLLHVTAPALMAIISGQIMREMRDLRPITDQSETGLRPGLTNQRPGSRWGWSPVVVCVTADQSR